MPHAARSPPRHERIRCWRLFSRFHAPARHNAFLSSWKTFCCCALCLRAASTNSRRAPRHYGADDDIKSLTLREKVNDNREKYQNRGKHQHGARTAARISPRMFSSRRHCMPRACLSLFMGSQHVLDFAENFLRFLLYLPYLSSLRCSLSGGVRL